MLAIYIDISDLLCLLPFFPQDNRLRAGGCIIKLDRNRVLADLDLMKMCIRDSRITLTGFLCCQ